MLQLQVNPKTLRLLVQRLFIIFVIDFVRFKFKTCTTSQKNNFVSKLCASKIFFVCVACALKLCTVHIISAPVLICASHYHTTVIHHIIPL